MNNAPRIAVIAAVLTALLLAAGCSKSSSKAQGSPSDAGLPAGASQARPQASLEFRELKLAIAADKAIKTVGGSGPAKQYCSSLVTPAAQKSPDNPSELLWDRRRAYCYLVGPTLTSGASIDKASVYYDSGAAQWAVNVHFANDDFITKIARPLVRKQIAIVLAGFVQSTPTINPGMNSRDVEIAGGFTKAGAVEVAAVIRGVAPSQVPVAPPSG